MLLAIVAVIIGLIVLVWSADTFIDGATELAVRFNVPGFLIGVIILGIGTSAPELVVSALSAYAGSPGLALGNAYGSNIINIALVLGATALISPLLIRRAVVYQDMLLLLAVTGLSLLLMWDQFLTRGNGMVLLLVLAGVLVLQVFLALRGSREQVEDLPEQATNTFKAFFTLMIGLLMLIVSSRAIVWGAVELATLWGMSELLIGLTIIAIGTSLPELVASVVAAKRGEHEMALGNIIGSNLFNTLGVVGLAAVIHPMVIEPEILSRDLMAVLLITLLLLGLCAWALRSDGILKRSGGALLLASFVAYTAWLLLTSI